MYYQLISEKYIDENPMLLDKELNATRFQDVISDPQCFNPNVDVEAQLYRTESNHHNHK